VQAVQEALRLLPGDGRPHYELALLYASALPENATSEDLKPVMDELKIVEKLLPAYAPNVHDALDFMGAFWAVETARAEASSIPGLSATTAPTQGLIRASTPEPSMTPLPLPTVTAPAATTGVGQGIILGIIAIVVVLVIMGILIVKRLGAGAG